MLLCMQMTQHCFVNLACGAVIHANAELNNVYKRLCPNGIDRLLSNEGKTKYVSSDKD